MVTSKRDRMTQSHEHTQKANFHSDIQRSFWKLFHPRFKEIKSFSLNLRVPTNRYIFALKENKMSVKFPEISVHLQNSIACSKELCLLLKLEEMFEATIQKLV